MSVLCHSCGQAHTEREGPLPPRAYFAGRVLPEPLPGGDLYRCPSCSLRFRHPMPPKAELDALYDAVVVEQWQYEAPRRADWSLARIYLNAHVPHPPGAEAPAVLDVGCFDGAFLSTLGDGWRRYGVELNAAAAERAAQRGARVLQADALRLDEVTETFDAVTAFDLIEHVPDPRDLLRAMAARVRPGGLIIVGTGNAAAWTWRLMGSRYWYSALGEHLAFISPAWCEGAARALGLEVLGVERYSHPSRRRRGDALAETAKNLLYRAAPGLYGALRARGLGTLDVHRHPSLRTYPPFWMTARDQLLAVFRKG